ncbi:hypothetical protein evm_013597 [Chilo suppressalis]|nr:hypothetical protein evm_013597 [Chilo suppressalis]
MNFAKIFFFLFAVFLATSTVSAAPKWKIFKKIVEWYGTAELCAGQTLFIPSGWIHAVLTPCDSLVFGETCCIHTPSRCSYRANSAESYMMRMRDISESVSRVRDNVSTARRLQELHSAHEARDRNRAEEMCAKVMTWSMVQIVLMMTVGATQVCK